MSLADDLMAQGYFRTSGSTCGVSRINRKNWKEWMAKEHASWDPDGEGMSWVSSLGRSAADHYRRVYSTDNIRHVPEEEFRKIPNSSDTDVGYIHIEKEDVLSRKIPKTGKLRNTSGMRPF